MDNFASRPGAPNHYGVMQNESNAIAPGKRPLSSMAPTIACRAGKGDMVLGTPGGPTIVSAMAQALLYLLEFGWNPRDSVCAPRIHHQWLPDELVYEPYGLSGDTQRALAARGHKLIDKPRYLGDCEGIMIEEKTGMRLGATDPRRSDGAAVGY